jgi:hypothetical protein
MRKFYQWSTASFENTPADGMISRSLAAKRVGGHRRLRRLERMQVESQRGMGMDMQPRAIGALKGEDINRVFIRFVGRS